MFKTITRAKAIPAKDISSGSTGLELGSRESEVGTLPRSYWRRYKTLFFFKRIVPIPNTSETLGNLVTMQPVRKLQLGLVLMHEVSYSCVRQSMS